jgi:hypothetical protein
MTMTVMLLSLATIILAVVFASYAARAYRGVHGVHDVARSLGERGTDVRQIARRTGLAQDVVSMLLARSAPRQKVPAAAGTSRPSGSTTSRNTQTPARTSAKVPAVAAAVTAAARADKAMRGTDVAIA